MNGTLQARSRVLRNLVTAVFVILVLALGIEILAIALGRQRPEWLLIYRLPMLFYLWAIWTARRAIASIERGEMFDAVVPRLLTHVGLAIFLGALVNVFAAPALLWLIEARSGLFAYDVAAITLGVVGLTLVLVAQLLRGAAAMRAELDEMF